MNALKKIMVLSLFFVTGKLSAQDAPFTFNIVKIGYGSQSDYGLIIGQDNFSCYFIIIRGQKERLPASPDVSIQKMKNVIGNSRLLHSVEFAGYKVGLYTMGATAIQFQNSYYSSEIYPGEEVNILGDGRVKEPILEVAKSRFVHIVNKYSVKDGIGVAEKRDGESFRGMPLIDKNGNLIGICAETNSRLQNLYMFLSLSKIYELIQKLENTDNMPCKYFTLLKVGQERTFCEQQQYEARVLKETNEARIKAYSDSLLKEKLAREKLGSERKAEYRNAIKDYNRNRKYNWSWGPSFTYQFNLSAIVSSEGSFKFNYTPTQKIMGGVNVFLSPDEPIHFTLQPRFGIFKIGIPPDYNAPKDFNFGSLDYNIAEMPVLLELLIGKDRDVTNFIGVGYVPGGQFGYTLKYSGKNNVQVSLKEQGFRYNHSYTIQGGWNLKRFRLGFYIQQQLNSFNERDLEILNGNISQRPFADYKRLPTAFGIDLVYRLRSIWSEKTRDKSSKPRPSNYFSGF